MDEIDGGAFMECKFEIDVKEPDATGMLFRPYIEFRIIQLNMTPNCMTDGEIDYQINELINKVEKLRKTAKKKLKAAQSRHDKIVSEKRKKHQKEEKL